MLIAANCIWSFVCCVIILCVFLLPHVYCFYCVCIAVLHTVVAGLLARSQYSESPATGHPDTGFSWFPCVYNQMLRRFPTLQVATACFSCSPADLNSLDHYFIYICTCIITTAIGWQPICSYIIIIIIIIIIIFECYHDEVDPKRFCGLLTRSGQLQSREFWIKIKKKSNYFGHMSFRLSVTWNN